MKYLLLAILLFNLRAASQSIQVKCDSIVERHGTWAKLSGLKMQTNERIYFTFGWRGAGRVELLNKWYTINPTPKRIRHKLVYVQKNG